jgi:hypothetical protein
MVNENIIPKTETVYELKNEIPSFEEFMKDYKDGNLNYADLNGGSISEVRGYGPCSYSEYVVDSWKVGGRHIKRCGDRDCSYYRRIVGNREDGTLGTAASIGAGTFFYFGAMALSPFTGGASLIAAAAAGSAASVGIAAGGTALTLNASAETLNEIEGELKSKWIEEKERSEERIRERERRRELEREKTRKINSLQGQLNESRRELERAIERMDSCKSDSDYMREKNEKERLENKVRNLKRDLCREKDCNCGGYCL